MMSQRRFSRITSCQRIEERKGRETIIKMSKMLYAV